MIALYAITALLTTTLVAVAVADAPEPRDTEDLLARIVGCADLECPTAGGESTVSNCTVGDRSFSSVGLARISFGSESDLNLTGISWVQGSSIVDNSGRDGRIFSSTFFLGTPYSFTRPDGLRGCAVFLLGAKGNIDFSGGPAEEAEGTCSDAMNDDCIAALVDQAESFDFGPDDDGDDDACEALQEDLARNFDTACRSAAGGDGWSDIMAARKQSARQISSLACQMSLLTANAILQPYLVPALLSPSRRVATSRPTVGPFCPSRTT